MPAPLNRFKAALAAGDKQVGFWLGLCSPISAELCATAGFDWLLIDGEHAPNDLQTMLAQLLAVAPYRATPIVRVPDGDTVKIKQVLELSVQTLLVPMVETAEQARQVVAAAKYAPEGVRGVGSALARASRWLGVDDYLTTANAQICVVVQVESVAALSQLEAIASVDGVDAVFLGPADLAASMGHLGNPAHPDVQQAMRDGVRRLQALGKPAGTIVGGQAAGQASFEQGYQFVAVGVDTTVLAKAARELAAAFGVGATQSQTAGGPY